VILRCTNKLLAVIGPALADPAPAPDAEDWYASLATGQVALREKHSCLSTRALSPAPPGCHDRPTSCPRVRGGRR